MKHMFGLAVAAGLAAVPQALPAQSGPQAFSVTNATSHTLACGASRSGSAKTEIVVLRPGQEWHAAARSTGPRSWYCDPPAASARYRLRAGVRYQMVEDRENRRIVLTTGGPA